MSSTSVVIPSYNGARFVAAALESVFAQTRQPLELIVVDDASTDDTPELVERMAISAPIRVKLVRLRTNSGGPAAPLTVGFDLAVGEFIATLDQDDVFLTNKLERQEAILQACPEAAFVFGESGRVDRPDFEPNRAAFDALMATGKCIERCLWANILSGPQVLGALVRFGNFITGFPGFVFRKKAWSAVRPLDAGLRIGSDYDFLCRLCQIGHAAYVPEVHYLRREHETNMCRAVVQVELDCARVRYRYWKAISAAELKAARIDLRKAFLDASYGARKAERCREAWECIKMAATVCGWDRRTLVWSAKLFAEWFLGRSRRSTTFPPHRRSGSMRTVSLQQRAASKSRKQVTALHRSI